MRGPGARLQQVGVIPNLLRLHRLKKYYSRAAIRAESERTFALRFRIEPQIFARMAFAPLQREYLSSSYEEYPRSPFRNVIERSRRAIVNRKSSKNPSKNLLRYFNCNNSLNRREITRFEDFPPKFPGSEFISARNTVRTGAEIRDHGSHGCEFQKNEPFTFLRARFQPLEIYVMPVMRHGIRSFPTGCCENANNYSACAGVASTRERLLYARGGEEKKKKKKENGRKISGNLFVAFQLLS